MWRRRLRRLVRQDREWKGVLNGSQGPFARLHTFSIRSDAFWGILSNGTGEGSRMPIAMLVINSKIPANTNKTALAKTMIMNGMGL